MKPTGTPCTKKESRFNHSIIKNDTFEIGRFTIVHVKDINGISAVGISRCSSSDQPDKKLGYSIARGRAERALESKKLKRRINHPYMG